MGQLDGRAAIVTGGAMGIGGATARRLAASGAHVLVTDIDLAAAEANVERIRDAGGVAEAWYADVAQQSEVERMIETAVARFGRLDLLVNNAFNSYEADGSAVTLTDSALDYALTIMIKSLVWSVRYAMPYLEQRGKASIVNIASVHGYMVAPGRLSYETGKAAVIALSRQMAVDFGAKGVRVNAICPGHIVTERMEQYWAGNPSLLKLVEAQYPVGRAGLPDDIANAVHFLCSDEAAFITGHALVVDGGMTIQLQEDFGWAQARFMRDHPDTQLPEA
jgi:NAD(P)-dependent dehydrogenase (short-subunit alcohol dehydrogenase family)